MNIIVSIYKTIISILRGLIEMTKLFLGLFVFTYVLLVYIIGYILYTMGREALDKQTV